jgi:hypothetical protein
MGKLIKSYRKWMAAFAGIAIASGLAMGTAHASVPYVDVCGTVTVNGEIAPNVVVVAWECVSNTPVAQAISDGQISNNYHVVNYELPDDGDGTLGNYYPLDSYVTFSYSNCPAVVITCEEMAIYYERYDGKPIVDIDIQCFSDGGDARTPGYWQNKHGIRLIRQNDLLPMLNECCLRDAKGNDADFANTRQYKAWMKKRNAENMAYQLSGHLAAMKLNIAVGYVDSGDMIYAPGCNDDEGDYVTIGSIVDLADAALCENGLTVESGDDRDYQECLKNALDAANNNQNWVE